MERERRSGQCWEAGPWGTRCTEHYTHRYSHYDASDDSSFSSDWRDWYDEETLKEMNDTGEEN